MKKGENKNKKDEHALLLRASGLKATKARIALLDIFEKNLKPLSLKKISESLKRKDIDQATLYRTVDSLEKIGVLRRVNLEHDHAHYELANTHHHHAICEKCGRIEDVSSCNTKSFEREVLKRSGFKKINKHSLEFFGLCKNCAKK